MPREAYISSINLAWHEWQDANPARVRDLLEATRPASGGLDFRSFEWFYLDQLGRTPLWTYTANELFGSNLVLGPEGTWVAAALNRRDGQANDIVVLDAHTGKEIRKIVGRRVPFTQIAISPVDNQLVTLDADGMVVFLDVETGEERQRLFSTSIQPTGVGRVTFSHDGRYLARPVPKSPPDSSRSSVELWDVAAKRKVQSFSMRPDDLGARPFSVSPDGSRMAIASGKLNIWNVSTGKVEKEIDTSALLTDVSFSPDGTSLAVATFTGWIGLWDPATGLRGRTLSGHRGEIHRIDFSPDGRRLASAGRDRVVRIWDVFSGNLHLELRGHESEIWDVGFTRDGHHLVSVGFHDGEVKLWGTERAPESNVLSQEPLSPMILPTFGLAFSPDGRVLAATQAAGTLQVWDPGGSRPLYRIDSRAAIGRGWVAIGPRSDVLAMLDDKRSIVLRNPFDRRRDSDPGLLRKQPSVCLQPEWPVPGRG